MTLGPWAPHPMLASDQRTDISPMGAEPGHHIKGRVITPPRYRGALHGAVIAPHGYIRRLLRVEVGECCNLPGVDLSPVARDMNP